MKARMTLSGADYQTESKLCILLFNPFEGTLVKGAFKELEKIRGHGVLALLFFFGLDRT